MTGAEEKAPRLKRAIERWEPVRVPSGDRPVQTRDAARRVRDLVGDVTVAQPSTQGASEAYDRIGECWVSRSQLDTVSLSDLSTAPWHMFAVDVKDSLAAEDRFTDAYLRELGRRAHARPIAATICAFLFAFPTNLKTFTRWRAGLLSVLQARDSTRLLKWRARCDEFGLLSEEGPLGLARRLFAGDVRTAEVLSAAGLDGALEGAAVVREAFVTGLESVRERYSERSPKLEEVAAVLRELDVPDGVRFGLWREAARALILPFASHKRASEDIRLLLKNFFVRKVGDPRLRPAAWQGVEDCAAVLRGWIVGITIDLFFDLLDRTTNRPDQFRERREFWTPYFEKGRVEDASIVLGDKARAQARRLKGGGDLSYGKLRGSPDQARSVLIMVIRGVKVVEGTHNMRVRIWASGGPRLHDSRYEYTSLIHGDEDTSYVHRGDWQGKVKRALRRMTGVR